ncbi:MAG: aldo/keto reductase family protein [Polyangiales bacterium]
MVERTRNVGGVAVPSFMYGTAWKKDRTEGLVREALAAGFRGIDTANQRKHYNEQGVGDALRGAFAAGELAREDLFLQTKYTPPAGQDHRLPYDAAAPVADKVHQSFERSLEHLGVEVLDSYVLHGPSAMRGLGVADREAWAAMEELHDAGRTRLLGVSNVAPDQLEELLELARVRPAFVQNRCFARRGWDAHVREICDRHGIVYQGFSLLTANQRELARPEVRQVAERHGRTVPQVVFRFALQLGMLPLTGTTAPQHMREDLQVYDFELSDDDMWTVGHAGT